MKYFIILTIFVISSCSNHFTNKNTECDIYFSNIKSKWVKKENSVYYIDDLKFIWNDNKTCFLGQSQKNLTQLLGTPNEIKNHKVSYFLSDKCLNEEGGCFKLEFVLDNENTVIKVYDPLIEQDNLW